MKKILINLIIFILITSNLYYAIAAYSNKKSDSLNNNYKVIIVEKDLETQQETVKEINYEKYLSINKTNSFIEENETMPMSIIGNDNRESSPVSELPYRAVCYIKAEHSSGTKEGTGFLIDDNIVLTSADIAKGAYSIQVYPGKDVNSSPYGSAFVKNIITSNSYNPNSSTAEYNWAILKLNTRIGQTTGWLTLVRYEDYSKLDGEPFRTIGYPSNLVKGMQFTTLGTVINTTNLMFTHNADTTSGQEGSPVCRLSDFNVVGIISSDSGGSMFSNYGCRIDNDLFYTCLSIINED